MTKNELKINVFAKTIIGRTIAIFEWVFLLAAMALITSYIVFRLVITDHTANVSLCNGVTVVSSFCGFLIGLNIKVSLVIWRIWPINKKVAKKFIADQKKDLEKKITGRELLVKAAEEKFNNQIIVIDEEIEHNKALLEEFVKIEQSL